MNPTKVGQRSRPPDISVPRLFPAEPPRLRTGTDARLDANVAVREYIDGVLRRASDGAVPQARWISTTDPWELCAVTGEGYDALVNLAQVNNLRRINQYFRIANAWLPYRGIFVCHMETLAQRWARIGRKHHPPLAHLYYLLTFFLHRVFPKLPITKRLYFGITGGKNRVLSEAEVLGRLICCGFSILETREIAGYLYITARKATVTAPAEDPSYGPIFRAGRLGRGGKKIRVFKLRTMYPYSEYLQGYLQERNRLAAGGKINGDFRVTSWGRVCRRYWIDELPMLINWLKGDLKLVGVRPLSPQYASLYPAALLQRRQQCKPGLIPPFYADLPVTFEEILGSEERYLDEYEQHPRRTDMRYFCRAWWNILFRHARSA